MERRECRPGSPKLLVDGTLGKLARWLRLLGYDTRYVQRDAARIAYEARQENRLLLTRDHTLAHRSGLSVVLVESQALEDRIVEVVTAVGLPEAGAEPRCMHCNAPLQPLSVDAAKERVPAYVAETHEKFHRCPECGRIYWQGSHWRAIAHLIDRSVAQVDQDDAAESPGRSSK